MKSTRRFAALHPVFLLVLAPAALGAAEPASPPGRCGPGISTPVASLFLS